MIFGTLKQIVGACAIGRKRGEVALKILARLWAEGGEAEVLANPTLVFQIGGLTRGRSDEQDRRQTELPADVVHDADRHDPVVVAEEARVAT